MRRTRLGRSGLHVSALCLGTMTWGRQTSAAEAHAQIDLAAGRGVTFMDTAELCPVNPIRAETAGETERIIGDRIARGGRRDDWVIATKIAGRGSLARDGEAIGPAAIRPCWQRLSR
ncbi:MAG: aldo/keto reductase [Rhodobacteraceae bacterium]|nr:aldo/keto reductase [Paracoccaceae bacterium]